MPSGATLKARNPGNFRSVLGLKLVDLREDLLAGRVALGQKNVHQPWPLALLCACVRACVRPGLSTYVTDVTDVDS